MSEKDDIASILGAEQPSAGQKVPVKDQPEADEPVFTADEYVKHVKYMEMISLRASEPIRRLWDRAWGLYNNAYDFGTKAPWQSKNFIPRVNMTVRSATFMIKRALTGPTRPFSVEGKGDFGKMAAYFVSKLTEHHLDEANYVRHLTDSVHAGLLSHMMILKVYPVYAEKNSVYFLDKTAKPVQSMLGPIRTKKSKHLKLRVDPVDPYHIHLDPTGQNKFLIHDITMDLYDLVDMAKDKRSGYDMAEIAKIQADFTRHTTENPNAKEEFRAGQSPDSSDQRRARTVLIQEYYGDVWTTDGRLVARNVLYAIANQKYLIRPPVVNNFHDRKPPFVVAPLVRKPFSVWHQGFVEVVSGLQIMMTELVNLIMDANLFASAKAFEVDIDQVYDPLDFIQGISPGKVFKKRGGGFNNTPMVREISIGNVAQQALPIFQMLDREFQNGAGLNEFAMPTNRSSGSRTTATEVLEKSQAATSFMEEIARTTEEDAIEPLLEKVFHYIVDYQISFDDPFITELFGQELTDRLGMFMANPNFRKAMHDAPLKFKSRGLSNSISKLRELEKIKIMAETAKQFPELAERIDPDKALKKILWSLNWYEQDILRELGPDAPPVSIPESMPGGMPMPQTGFGDNAMHGMEQVPDMASIMGGQ